MSDTVAKLQVSLDEPGVRLLGLDKTAIARELDANLEGAIGGSTLEDTEELILKVRLANDRRGDLNDISSLNLTPNNEASIILKRLLYNALMQIEYHNRQIKSEI